MIASHFRSRRSFLLLDLLTNWQNQLLEVSPQLLPLTVLGLSLLGSPHCVAMCGVFCVGSSKQGGRYTVVFYHVGRLIMYITLGALAGILGQTLLKEVQAPILIFLAVMVGLVFIFSGFGLLGLRFRVTSKFFHRPYGWLFKKVNSWGASVRAFSVGLISGALPCGWLYSFILAAAAVKNPVYGALLLFMFWLGTLPALTIASEVFKRSAFASRLQGPVKIILAFVFIVYGAAVIAKRTHQLRMNDPVSEGACHSGSS